MAAKKEEVEAIEKEAKDKHEQEWLGKQGCIAGATSYLLILNSFSWPVHRD